MSELSAGNDFIIEQAASSPEKPQETPAQEVARLDREIESVNRGLYPSSKKNKFSKHPEWSIAPETVVHYNLDPDKFYTLTADAKLNCLTQAQSRALGIQMLRFVEKIDPINSPTLVFLDRSARQPSREFRTMWRELYPGIELPEIRYLNIGQEKFDEELEMAHFLEATGKLFAQSARDKTKLIDMISQQLPVYKNRPGRVPEGEDPNTFQPSIWIVDEARNTSISARLAAEMCRAALEKHSPGTQVYPVFLYSEQEYVPWLENKEDKTGYAHDQWKGVADDPKNPLKTLPLKDQTESLALTADLSATAKNVVASITNKQEAYEDLEIEEYIKPVVINPHVR